LIFSRSSFETGEMEMAEAKPGDVVKLAKDEGILVDYETGFEVSGSQEVALGKTIGQRTRLALQSGGLLIVKSAKTKKTKAESETE
jgi:hypothetical protein